VITPVNSLQPENSKVKGCVEFKMRRKNRIVILQWEGFSGALAQSGVSYLQVPQYITSLPSYKIYSPIKLRYLGQERTTFVLIDPNSNYGNIFFFLNSDGSSSGTNLGDNFFVYPSAVTWITDC
jgi:hypothetical protein